jgi:hypothetical protein
MVPGATAWHLIREMLPGTVEGPWGTACRLITCCGRTMVVKVTAIRQVPKYDVSRLCRTCLHLRPKVKRDRKGWWKQAALVGALLTGCTYYAPALCSRWDTVGYVILDGADSTPITKCVEWQAYDDSTLKWDTLGRKLP